METTTLALSVSRTVAANDTGYAMVTLGPKAAGESWVIKRISVQNTGVARPRFNLYRGSAPLITRFLEGTKSGNSDVSDSVISLQPIDSVTAEWVGAIAGSQCIIVIEGDQILSGRRAY